jgi:FkbM family methyltransferase
MNNVQEIKALYQAGNLSKAGFIAQMYESHKQLFVYAEGIRYCNLSSISITRGEVVAEFEDPEIKMLCPPGDNRIAPIEAFNFGSFESLEIHLVKRLVGRLGGASVNVYDVGANAGFYSLALAHYYPGINGVAFEPVPLTYTYLKRNLELNNIIGINALNLGLSDSPGDLTFAVSADHSGASFIANASVGANVQLVKCAVTTLDEFIAQGGIVPAFIKCDVEGAELMVFKGAEKLLKDHRPAIFTEMLRKWAKKFDYHPNDIIRLFSKLDYSCFVIRGERLVSFDRVEESTLDTNYVFLHKRNHAGVLEALC